MRNRGLAYQRIVGKAPNPPDPLLSLVNMSGEQCEHSVHSIQFDRIASVHSGTAVLVFQNPTSLSVKVDEIA